MAYKLPNIFKLQQKKRQIEAFLEIENVQKKSFKEEKMKIPRLTITIASVFAVFLFPFSAGKAANTTKGENHCFTCHTSARKLIKITREIAASNKDKPGASPETKGEG